LDNPALLLSAAGEVTGARRNEPITVGVPFPRSWCRDVNELSLVSIEGIAVPLQARVLDRWSDGSLRWALCDFVASAPAGRSIYRLERGKPVVRMPGSLDVTIAQRRASISAGAARFELRSDGALECRRSGSDASIVSEFQIVDAHGGSMPIRVEAIAHDEPGFLRTSVLVTAAVGNVDRPLRLSARYHFYERSAVVRIQVTLRNPARAEHAGGFWDLGDPGSRQIKDFAFAVSLPSIDGAWQTMCSPELSQPLRPCALPFEVYQDSSGGENWQSSNHVNRNGVVPTTFRGYRMREGSSDTHGLRATPVVVTHGGRDSVAVAQRQFWERFPRAIEATDGNLVLRFLPGQCPDSHELQGGEQISEEFVVSFGTDPISDVPLDWVRNPMQARADPAWYCAAEAIPYLTPASEDPNRDYLALVKAAVEGDNTFEVKRERIDEYGWRHFGDMYGDHETVLHQGASPLISHYNNQYDAVAGLICQFFRGGDQRWFALAGDLARHVVDIDIYHTTQDKAAYNHGLFWHTAHHADADRATHRTYARASTGGSGGPSSEHNYNTGLTLYYFLTGDTRARDAAIELADWAIDMDDGSKTPLRWLSRGPTGLASATGSFTYHGPGRGPGNSIVSLLNAFRLTGEPRYLEKAEALIRRCVHPADDIPALNLLDADRRWFYTVFLQAVGRYLDIKAERGEIDERHAYARATLLHYARWMADHEYPYLDKPEILEHPTETWAAQDMRKCEVFQYAAKHAAPSDQERFRERARFFFDYSVSTLSKTNTSSFTRPTVIMLTNGYSRAYFQKMDCVAPVAEATIADFGQPMRFRTQKEVALRRLIALGVLGAAAGAAALLSIL
jgi:hypothetical protein